MSKLLFIICVGIETPIPHPQYNDLFFLNLMFFEKPNFGYVPIYDTLSYKHSMYFLLQEYDLDFLWYGKSLNLNLMFNKSSILYTKYLVKTLLNDTILWPGLHLQVKGVDFNTLINYWPGQYLQVKGVDSNTLITYRPGRHLQVKGVNLSTLINYGPGAELRKIRSKGLVDFLQQKDYFMVLKLSNLSLYKDIIMFNNFGFNSAFSSGSTFVIDWFELYKKTESCVANNDFYTTRFSDRDGFKESCVANNDFYTTRFSNRDGFNKSFYKTIKHRNRRKLDYFDYCDEAL